jgi:hypothetical protein
MENNTYEVTCIECGTTIGVTSCEITATSMSLCESCEHIEQITR